jgi:four helix bundle protein
LFSGDKEMATIVRFEDLDAWKMARELTREIYRITKYDRFSRDFGLVNQIREASVSVMSNVAEGFERDGNKELCNFLSIGKGSAGEVRSQLYDAFDQDYISREDFDAVYDKATASGRVIAGLSNYLKQSNYKGLKFRR